MNKFFRKIVEHEPLTIQEQYLLSCCLILLQDKMKDLNTSTELIKQFGTMFDEAYHKALEI